MTGQPFVKSWSRTESQMENTELYGLKWVALRKETDDKYDENVKYNIAKMAVRMRISLNLHRL